jgi:hypothetical protein
MHDHSPLLKRACLGAAGGLLGTVAIQALMGATQKWLPQANPPMRQSPGEFMVEEVEEALPGAVRRHIPHAAEAVAAQGLGMGYGVAFGALYGALPRSPGSAALDGALLGLACWATGYLGWLPALGLMPPVSRQSPAQVAGPVVDHLAYGVVTVLAYDFLRRHFDPASPAEEELGLEPTAASAGA